MKKGKTDICKEQSKKEVEKGFRFLGEGWEEKAETDGNSEEREQGKEGCAVACIKECRWAPAIRARRLCERMIHLK